MKLIKTILAMTTMLSVTASIASAAVKKTEKLNTPIITEIKDYNYVCTHISKPEALVFKTTSPQKIWRTTLNQEGTIKKGKAFQLAQININAESIEKDGAIASFKANLAKDYEIKGFFSKDTDGDLPLTVVSSYLPDGNSSKIQDHYNCEIEKSSKGIRLGSTNKE